MFSIAGKEIKEFLRDVSNSFFYIAFPIMLVFLLGTLLKEADKSDSPIGEIKLRYIIETEDVNDINKITSFMEGLVDNKNIYVEQGLDLAGGKEQVGRDELTSLVVFSGNPLAIEIYEGNNSIKNRTVKGILHSFAFINETISTVIEDNPAKIADLDFSRSVYIEQKDLGRNRSMIDYYAITMLVMTSLMSMIIGAGVFMSERDYKTFPRLLASPKRRINIFFQKIIGIIPQIIVQQLIIMIFSVIVFGASYGVTRGKTLYLYLMITVVTFSMVCVGAIIGLLINVNPIVIIMPITWVMMFFGGTYSKELFIDGVTQLMPPYIIQQAAFDLTVFGRMEKATNVILVCGIIAIVALISGSIIFQRREEAQ